MNTYKIEFEYSLPEFSEVTLDAETPEQASTIALKQMEMAYPEAIDLKAIAVTPL